MYAPAEEQEYKQNSQWQSSFQTQTMPFAVSQSQHTEERSSSEIRKSLFKIFKETLRRFLMEADWGINGMGSTFETLHHPAPVQTISSQELANPQSYIAQQYRYGNMLISSYYQSSYQGFATKQIMRWISTAIYEQDKGKCEEVQCYCEDKFIYVSTNQEIANPPFNGQKVREFISQIPVTNPNADAKDKDRSNRHPGKLVDMAELLNLAIEVVQPANEEQRKIMQELTRIFDFTLKYVRPKPNRHAEVNIFAHLNQDNASQTVNYLQFPKIGGIKPMCMSCGVIVLEPNEFSQLCQNPNEVERLGPLWSSSSSLEPLFLIALKESYTDITVDEIALDNPAWWENFMRDHNISSVEKLMLKLMTANIISCLKKGRTSITIKRNAAQTGYKVSTTTDCSSDEESD